MMEKISLTYYLLSHHQQLWQYQGCYSKDRWLQVEAGYKDGKYLLNPSIEELKESKLDLVVAGTKDAVLMVGPKLQDYQ